MPLQAMVEKIMSQGVSTTWEQESCFPAMLLEWEIGWQTGVQFGVLPFKEGGYDSRDGQSDSSDVGSEKWPMQAWEKTFQAASEENSQWRP